MTPAPEKSVTAPDDAPASTGSGRRRAGVIALVILVLAAGGLTIALVGHHNSGAGSSAKARTSPSALSPGSVVQAARNRQQAAAWVAQQVSHSAIVSCDPQMCAELQHQRFPAGDLMPLSTSATDPMGSQIVVSTTALRNQFGSRLPDVYAPTVLQTFGTGESRVDIRVESAEGTQAYLIAQRAELLARQTAGQQLLGNKSLHISGTARRDIAKGYVDSRLLITIVGLISAPDHGPEQVYVSSFSDGGPDQATAPLRTMQIEADIPGQKGSAYQDTVLKFLHTQQLPYRAYATVLHQSHGTRIQIEFTAPGALGLLGPQAP